jgi:CRISPR-associated endonuclease Cas1
VIRNHRGISHQDMQPSRGVLVMTGYGLRLSVERGHLLAEDGAGTDRRAGRFPRVDSGIERVIVLGHSGSITLEALRWLHEIGAAFVQIGADGDLIATGAPHALTDVRLRRNQAAAMGTAEGLRIACDLLVQKVRGQAQVLDSINGHRGARDTLASALEDMPQAPSLDRLRFIESRAAAAYWSAWEDVPVRFAGRDARYVPRHWRVVGTRSSVLTASPRKASSPANALLNYLYAIVEAECRLASLAVGCDPALGVIHTDKPSRDSLACDLMEPVRPSVDEHVLRLLQTHTFERADFFETREGVCRVMPSVSRPLATSAAHWRRVIAPIAERLGGAFQNLSTVTPPLASASPRTRYRTPLTGANNSRHESRPLPQIATPLTKRCRHCGASLGNRRVVYCDDCRPAAAREAARKGVQVQKESRALGEDGRSTAVVRAKHRQSATRRAGERQAWEMSQATVPSRAVYREEIAPLVTHVPSAVLAEVTGLSSTFLGKVKRGETIPHPRHWASIRAASEDYLNANAENIELSRDRSFFAREIAPNLRRISAKEIQRVTGLSHSYSRRVLAGHHVPHSRHWVALRNLLVARELSR